MQARDFGSFQGRQVQLFTLTNQNGLQAQVTNFGGALVGLFVPDRLGNWADVVLGYDDLGGYLNCPDYLGVLVGRYANRIEQAFFILEGQRYELAANDGPNHIHGGARGFGKVLWEPHFYRRENQEFLELRYFSPHGEEGYPGNLEVAVTYSLDQSNALRLDYQARSDRPTILSLTNHSYFNLGGQAHGSILDHKLQLLAQEFTPITAQGLPTGEIRSVVNSPFDFREPKLIGAEIEAPHEQIQAGRGYDHNWIIEKKGNLNKAAAVYHPGSGRVLEVWTTLPGIQFYSGNSLKGGQVGKGGQSYGPRSGFCLETQYFPNSLVHSHFPSPVLQGGELYEHSTIFRFSCRAEEENFGGAKG